ncbi:endonuclease/exonuclease/phosphatase family protein [Ruegeria arenilitoris]|uniref:endonuclease/exonuclease/phosphatase family protein n=1 Tax=Ruegeria arenilitoris TaxID=1173585 RepID=UPI001480F3CA|nr:endonuclease/exonuclease/phosphatase family protein [Ruegeria arenilitoris]
MIRYLILLLLPLAAQADPLRVASFNTELSRNGPGVLLRDIERDDPQVIAVIGVLAAMQPDVVALQGMDWDYNNLALAALTAKLKAAGLDYAYSFSAQPNSGSVTGVDLDGDSKSEGPGDAQGWGRFTGQGGLAVLSRFPILTDDIADYSTTLWRDVPGARLPVSDDLPFPSEQAQSIQRLSSTAHWVIPIDAPGGRFDLMTFHASPPVFDGPEDRNGLRNRDEIRFWSLLLDGDIGTAPTGRFVIAGDANLDPNQGDGHKGAIRNLLADPQLQDPEPRDSTGSATTVAWKGVGEMRVDYVLPSADWQVERSGIYWTDETGKQVEAAATASRHRLIWVDLSIRQN